MPVKTELFQATRMPPEAPTEGRKQKSSKVAAVNQLNDFWEIYWLQAEFATSV